MRTWTRATCDRLCGLCGAHIAEGGPIQMLDIGPTIKLWRCPKCVGPPPPDLPPLVERRPIEPMVMTRFTKDMLPLDWKRRQSRDPGEEG